MTNLSILPLASQAYTAVYALALNPNVDESIVAKANRLCYVLMVAAVDGDESIADLAHEAAISSGSATLADLQGYISEAAAAASAEAD